MKFPKDEDGHVLKMLYKQGVDFSKTHLVDFFIAIPDQEYGERILLQLKELGLNGELQYDEEFEEWTCICSKEVTLDYEDIVRIQKELDELSGKLGGYVDGWGMFTE
ncbi:ribonuclease E inhibitor RraB [Bacillus mycoides]|uniref:ribonuclease E inhibitor RraB n=1 Tax=Bacillus mycoides TaxID=1405 RepID=UPI002E2097A8|nr:ribonuclease E inhibitor RraB [Bacillus mycoides]